MVHKIYLVNRVCAVEGSEYGVFRCYNQRIEDLLLFIGGEGFAIEFVVQESAYTGGFPSGITAVQTIGHCIQRIQAHQHQAILILFNDQPEDVLLTVFKVIVLFIPAKGHKGSGASFVQLDYFVLFRLKAVHICDHFGLCLQFFRLDAFQFMNMPCLDDQVDAVGAIRHATHNNTDQLSL